MTEIQIATCTKISEKPKRLERCINGGQEFTSSGRFLPKYEGKVLDLLTGKELGPNEVGELYVRAPHITGRYLKPGNQIETSSIDKDGWFETGDLCFMDEKRNLYIKDRVKFTYRYKYDVVMPTEVESVLQQHPDVQEAGVVGISHPDTHSATRALVVLKPGRGCSAKDLCKFVADRCPEHKQLHAGVQFVKSLPVNKGGKLDRQALKSLAVSGI
ncbi:luciferin 4-monooxygenase-like isoform X2 [Neocloeon triangulifer]|uniref:luciferin 4-monooxygenase-like isoform X2 n=1 Tax=Neocloeon triangulifer TaxID=2078957 RepID=UPI00286F435C|nr:luciferin 4-monooxygenase-like isoform X2 [Neocloeon triangulifer]